MTAATFPPPVRLEDRNTMTEADAAEKWCPWSRGYVPSLDHQGATSANRFMLDGEVVVSLGCRCIGSRCAAWRWRSTDRGECGIVGL